MEYDEFSAMNTTIQVAAEGDRRDLEAGFARVRDYVAQSEQRFSRFRSNSELSELNRSAGRWFQASQDMVDLLQEAIEMYEMTDRFFNPSILGALKMIGYDRSMDEIRKVSRLPEMNEYTWITPPFEDIQIDSRNNKVFLPQHVQIDLGGIAKGWIAERSAQKLAEITPACLVSAGGDMAIIGRPAGEDFWQISLEDPRDSEQVLAILKVGPGAVATSTITKRHWLQGDQSRNHIIDPRVGFSIDPEWLSVTVYSSKASVAEAFAKTILIAGPEQGLELAARVEGLTFIAVEPDGSLWGTPQSKEIVYVPEPIH